MTVPDEVFVLEIRGKEAFCHKECATEREVEDKIADYKRYHDGECTVSITRIPYKGSWTEWEVESAKQQKSREYRGYFFTFTRRRYGGKYDGTTYTWPLIRDEIGRYIPVPNIDPYPAVIPSRDYLNDAIESAAHAGIVTK